MRDWFGYTEVEQANTDTGCKQHCEICAIAEFRFFIIFAEFEVAVFREIQIDQKDNKYVHSANVEPGKGGCNPRFDLSHFMIGAIRVPNTPRDKAPNHNSRDNSYDWIKIQSYWTKLDFKSMTTFASRISFHSFCSTDLTGLRIYEVVKYKLKFVIGKLRALWKLGPAYSGVPTEGVPPICDVTGHNVSDWQIGIFLLRKLHVRKVSWIIKIYAN